MSSITDYIEPIGTFNSEEYEYLQYNEDLRIVHNITRDTFRANDIIACLGSVKDIHEWIKVGSTRELISELDIYHRSGNFPDGGITPLSKEECVYTQRDDNKDIQGVYVHKILINSVAMWASPRYAYKIMNFLNKYYDEQREEKIRELTEEKDTLLSKVNKLLTTVHKQSKHMKVQSKKIDTLIDVNNEQTSEIRVLHKKIEIQSGKIEIQSGKIDRMKTIAEDNVELTNIIKSDANQLTDRIVPETCEQHCIRLEILNYNENNDIVKIISKCIQMKYIKRKYYSVPSTNKQIYYKINIPNAITILNNIKNIISKYIINDSFKNRKWEMEADRVGDMVKTIEFEINKINSPIEDINEIVEDVRDGLEDINDT